MMAQFMMDLKTEPRLSPSLYSPASPKMVDSPNCGRPQSTDSGVLDLSKRRDSLETSRKTPSPSYHCFTDIAGTPPPSNHSSPQCEVASTAESSIVLNYSELLARGRHLSPTKSLLHFDDLHHHHRQQQQQQQHPEPAALIAPAVAFHHALALSKPETTESLLQQHLLQRGGPNGSIPSYLLPGVHHHHRQHSHPQQPFVKGASGAPAQQTPLAPFSPSPIRLRELDAISESGSEGTSLVSSSHQRKAPANDDSTTMASKMTQQQQQYPMVVGRDGKLSRPFKAYPKDPLSLAAGFVASDTILDTNSAEKYNLFRKRMLEQIHAANGGQPTVSNPKMRRLAAKSSSSTAALSDASSESCDEKTSSSSQQQQHQRAATAIAFESKMATKEMKRTGTSAVTNQQRLDDDATSPSQQQDDERHCDSDSSHHSADRSCDVTSRTDTDGNEQQQQQQQDKHLASSSTSSSGAPTSGVKDSAYYERRKKNNAAAKKSRDRRRIKEDEIAIRAAFLERENIELKFELAAARKQLALYGVTASVAS
ncbi:protein giant-like [Anopheles aquasalis]|uniref:protein giant-like n=1 Tax=Anopheles aquasalis TaxID=42839 RepID=UPI00215A92FC|nr:protein giant-like [Anopheles aquasalis]